jgi:hypothetical protein
MLYETTLSLALFGVFKANYPNPIYAILGVNSILIGKIDPDSKSLELPVSMNS